MERCHGKHMGEGRVFWVLEGKPRVMWYLPASAFTFMIWQGLRNVYVKPGMDRDANLGIERNASSIDTVVT